MSHDDSKSFGSKDGLAQVLRESATRAYSGRRLVFFSASRAAKLAQVRAAQTVSIMVWNDQTALWERIVVATLCLTGGGACAR